jgi:hypothetical protein
LWFSDQIYIGRYIDVGSHFVKPPRLELTHQIIVSSTNTLEVSVQYPKLRVPISPNFARTEDEIRSQDENSTQQERKGPNRFSDLDWSSGDSPPSFEFALLTPSLLLIFLVKSNLVRIIELSVKSPCLHPVFGPDYGSV